MKLAATCPSLLLAALVASCTLEPHYHRPEAPVPDGWPAPASAETSLAASDIGWRNFFADARIQRLIEIALVNSRDLRIAALNVQAAQAQYRIQRADLFPTIEASAAEQIQSLPLGVLGSAGTPGTGGTTRAFTAEIGFTAYELDLFGRIRSLNHAALEQYFSQEETRLSSQLSLIAEVAGTYFAILGDEALLKLTQDTLEAARRSYDLTKQSFDRGVLNELSVRQAQTTVDTARANLAGYARQLALDRDALTLLLGAPVPADLPEVPELSDEALAIVLPAGVPSDVLTRRPDVLAAEHQLVASNANIGAARAAFFPTILLTGGLGTASTELSGLFASGSRAWNFSPQISVPIFAGGRNVASLDLAQIEKNVSVAQYERAIQTAFREVADALASRATLDDQLAAQQSLVEGASRAYALSEMRFNSGIDNYLTLLDSQRALYAAQQGLLGIRITRLQNLVTLYKALGGGAIEQTGVAPKGRR